MADELRSGGLILSWPKISSITLPLLVKAAKEPPLDNEEAHMFGNKCSSLGRKIAWPVGRERGAGAWGRGLSRASLLTDLDGEASGTSLVGSNALLLFLERGA